MTDQRKVMIQAIAHYGQEHQIDKAIEEFAELTQALIKHRQGNTAKTANNVLEELADASIMIDQLTIIYSKKAVDAVRQEKIDRLKSRLEK